MKIITDKDIFFSAIIPTTTEVLATRYSVNADIKCVEDFEHKSDSRDTIRCLDITGMLGFSASNALVGSILMTFQLDVALAIVGGMLGCSREEAKHDVTDGIGEFVNIITGNIQVKLREQGIEFSRSIPNIVTGRGAHISTPASTSKRRIEFESAQGRFFFEIAFKED